MSQPVTSPPEVKTPVEPSPGRLLSWVMIAVAAWGGMLALGTFLFGLDEETGKPVYSPNPARGLVVLAVVATFLGVWCLALRSRKRHNSNK
ncbi:MAG: hypothetical protein VB878_23405 [Pirellulaceae bacterium]